ncbi:hypothetical protein PHACT_12505 [Pseudohongiella acticola]|uniref:Uncharacterized protein n=1 Tax=Pseudohongiella acticola TaxID=1524254 RepID=A0A1E8CG86_9GAMM|nr:hypothetical protein [Pseudohongiella acticola]OFE11372.1 hypothetical protein PHACT_12505 [Pseudohongiella acticola]
MTTIGRGNASIGMSSVRASSPTLPLPQQIPTLADEVARLTARFQNLETLVERKADNDTLRSAIRISPESILLEAKDVGVLGTFTVAAIIDEQNGTTTGNVPLAITQIRGDVIRTGTIVSNNWGTSAGTAINLNDGTIIIGGSDSPTFEYDGTDLTLTGTITADSVIANTVTVDGVEMGTIKSNSATGASHAGASGNPHGTSLTQVSGDLDDIADGSTYFRANINQLNGAGRAFSALDSSFDYIRTLGTQKIAISGSNPLNGGIIDVNGLRWYQAGSPTFVLAASGGATFSGDVVTVGRVVASGGETVSGQLAAMHAICGAVGGSGLYASRGSSGSQAILADGNGGTALTIVGLLAKVRVTNQVIEIWNHSDGTYVGKFEYRFGSP